MAVNGSGSLVILVIVFFGALAFQAQVEGKPQDNFKRDKADNVSRIVANSYANSLMPKEARKGQFPWQVWMNMEDGLCGGSIIDQQWVMSAAHCIAELVVDNNGKAHGYKITEYRKIDIIAGVTDKNDKGESRQTREFSPDDISATGNDKRVFIHKDYNKNIAYNNDIVLFKLKKPLELNGFVKPIMLATAEDYKLEEKNYIASGWGLTGIAGTEECDFPFKNNGDEHWACISTNPDSDRTWCKAKKKEGANKRKNIWCDDTIGCVFPFTYDGKHHSKCKAMKPFEDRPWCSTVKDLDLNHMEGNYKFCDGHYRYPDKLGYVEGLMLKSPSECKTKFVASNEDFDEDTMICHSTKNKEINYGDSGGPFVLPKRDPHIYGTHAYVQIGISSWGLTDYTKRIYNSAFTNVAHFRPWIHTTMGYSPDDPNCPDGYFHSSGSWYRMFKDQGPVSWEDAQRKCRSKGMQLAEPNKAKAVELRKDALNKLGDDSNAWIGARGHANGLEFVFEVSREKVPQKSHLFWIEPEDEDISSVECLFLEVNQEMWEEYPGKPYFYEACSGTNNYPLCEDSPDNQASTDDLCQEKGGHCIPDFEKCECETTIENLVNSVDDACVCCLPPVCQAGTSAFLTRSGSKRCLPTTEVMTTTDVVPTTIVKPTTTTCPDDEAFFTLNGTKQCFKVLKQSATWEQANNDCMELNLTLAQPFAPVQLRSYIVQTYGPEFYVWLGACQDETNQMMWKKSGEVITIEDPLWYPGQPDFDEGCLLLLSSEEYLEEEPEKPFWNVLSKYEFYPLCELVLA